MAQVTFVIFGDSLKNRGTVRVTGVQMADARLSLRCVFGDLGSGQSLLCSGRCVLFFVVPVAQTSSV